MEQGARGRGEEQRAETKGEEQSAEAAGSKAQGDYYTLRRKFSGSDINPAIFERDQAVLRILLERSRSCHPRASVPQAISRFH